MDNPQTAEALKEVAVTTGKAIDTVNGLGSFLSKVLGPAAQEFGALWHDKVRFHRATQLLRLNKRFEELRASYGIAGEPRTLDFKVALPLLEAASLETDDDLQDMFTRLLVNGTDINGNIEIRRAFVSILQDFGPLEAKLLVSLCNAPKNENGAGIGTGGLPDAYIVSGKDDLQPSQEVALALWNLSRLGCIEPSGTWGGGSSISSVSVTALGKALLDACTLKSVGQ